jgi:inorganic phosphate transporter, PiT family
MSTVKERDPQVREKTPPLVHPSLVRRIVAVGVPVALAMVVGIWLLGREIGTETAVLLVVVVIALVFDYTNGFHDAANAIATSVSTRALTPRVALIMAALMNLLGALLGTESERSPGTSSPGTSAFRPRRPTP